MQPVPLLLLAVAVATSSPHTVSGMECSLSWVDVACVSPVRQDLKFLVSYRTKRNLPSPSAKDFPRSSAILALIWFTVMWSSGRAHGIFVGSASAPQSHWVRVATILSSSS